MKKKQIEHHLIGYDADGDLINLQINRKRIINQDTREVLYDPKWYK
ncbi:hypothetical protein NWE59_04915 [Mycoplasmopsis felis]|nr:hypothetical protein [Mycoplasmopsis felis]UWV78242.1 hypothetical protein NWE59_04915 [Mycoplasmopsis felis]